MLVAIASGKGGTGKTTVAASLATIWSKNLVVADLDVEEPNLGLFLNPEKTDSWQVDTEVPVLNLAKCKLCKTCSEFCQFNAISILGKSPVIYPEMCHSCGGCIALCPEGALNSGARELGIIEQGKVGHRDFIMGRLRIGEAMSPPLIKAVKKEMDRLSLEQKADALMDAPPGVSCPAVSAVSGADFIALVTEPTPFGLHDLKLAVEAFATLKIPMAVIINRDGIGDNAVDIYCQEAKLPIVARIPFDRAIASAYSTGQCIANLNSELKDIFVKLEKDIRRLAGEGVS